ncbi:L-cystine transport system permease protein TcyL [Klebsiella huaxiensis]|uniref:amino acid ABC transporter permease n=1 Tax=Klebsiella huaxiensis TaxID=2153354 RepID=UPI00115BD2E8|nr:amino acid ABC transporter permease [Klebsiella huaxiensis]VUT20450.1 L-cystine transport system permease protein TcyL [Klebsiella huaxiensis]
MFSFAFIRDNFTFILSALPVTLAITLLSLLFSTLLGAVLAYVIIRQTPGIKYVAKIFISFGRSVPVLVMLYFFFYVWPWIAAGLFGGPQENMFSYKLSPLVAAVTALSLIFSAYFAETFRAGWNAVDKGQREAAWSIGVSGFTQFRRIIFPQAAVSALPNFTSVLIDLIKDTSLVYTITVIDLMAKANIAAARGFHFVEAYCVVLVIYIVLCLAIARALRSVEISLSTRWRGDAQKRVATLSFWGKYFEK